jgi:hypothetical protein
VVIDVRGPAVNSAQFCCNCREVTMFGGVVEGKYGGGEAELPCIYFEIGVD